MEERDQIIIERYLAHELSEAERAEVEQRRKEDPVFRQALDDFEKVMEALVIKQREELRQRFRDRDKKLDAGSQVAGKSSTYRLIWVAVAAILVMGLLLWKFLFTIDQPAAPVYTNVKDSTGIDNQQPLVHSPTSTESKEGENQSQDQKKIQEQRQLNMADATEKGKELYAENFEPYKDETMSPVSRGGEELKPLDKFRQYYWDGKYPETVATFSTLNTDHQKNDNLRFMYAISLASVDRNSEAQSEFINIIEHHRSIYTEQANWYLALVYLKQGDMKNASKYLQICVGAPEGYHKTEAADLLKKIN